MNRRIKGMGALAAGLVLVGVVVGSQMAPGAETKPSAAVVTTDRPVPQLGADDVATVESGAAAQTITDAGDGSGAVLTITGTADGSGAVQTFTETADGGGTVLTITGPADGSDANAASEIAAFAFND